MKEKAFLQEFTKNCRFFKEIDWVFL